MPLKGPLLDRVRFELLLAHMGGPEHYEGLRRRLIAYFRWEQCREPEQLADQTIDRLARRVAEGAEIADWKAYAAGIARLVHKEHLSALKREGEVLREIARMHPADSLENESASSAERTARDLEVCLQRFTGAQRDQILRYYEGDYGRRVENRRHLAGELALAPNALRNRMLRLRKLLVECMAARAKGRDESGVLPTTIKGSNLTGDGR